MSDNKVIVAPRSNSAAVPVIRIQDELSLESVSEMIVQSGMFQVKNRFEVAVRLMAGAALGLGPWESMESIDLIQGRPALRAHTRAALVKRSGKYEYRVHENTDKKCVIEFFQWVGDEERKCVSLGISEYGIEDAQKMGLATRDNWKKQPKTMLYCRAISRGQRMFCPEVTMAPIYDPDELLDAAAPLKTSKKKGTAAVRESLGLQNNAPEDASTEVVSDDHATGTSAGQSSGALFDSPEEEREPAEH